MDAHKDAVQEEYRSTHRNTTLEVPHNIHKLVSDVDFNIMHGWKVGIGAARSHRDEAIPEY
jgi:hypothetical protein